MSITIKNSDTHPITVDFIECEKLKPRGRLGLTFAPGKKRLRSNSGPWDRDMDKDLKILRACYKTDLLISLLEEHEFRVLGVPTLLNRAEEHGIQVIWFPIAGRSVPMALKEFAVLVQRIINAMCSGKTTVIHCMGGMGRTGLVAASCLVAATELTPQEAITTVRRMRPGSIETTEQEEYVSKFQMFLKK